MGKNRSPFLIKMRGGLIVVRAGESFWAEAYDNLDLFCANERARINRKMGVKCNLGHKKC
jgi:hypothetical protein